MHIDVTEGYYLRYLQPAESRAKRRQGEANGLKDKDMTGCMKKLAREIGWYKAMEDFRKQDIWMNAGGNAYLHRNAPVPNVGWDTGRNGWRFY